jgi:ABC-type spermidine/putrescine transport system permease subunit II
MDSRAKGNPAFMFEHVSEPVLPRRQFQSRLLRSLLIGQAMIAVSLLIGMVGYRYLYTGLDWADAFVNAAMILSGMGPMAMPVTSAAKIFSGVYALYSGLMLVMTAGVIFGPVVHRFLHKLHADEDEDRHRDADRPRKPAKEQKGEV